MFYGRPTDRQSTTNNQQPTTNSHIDKATVGEPQPNGKYFKERALDQKMYLMHIKWKGTYSFWWPDPESLEYYTWPLVI
jgi:hypothetical protein